MAVRGVRGATTVVANEAEAILSATATLLREMVDANQIDAADVGCVTFTVTADLNAAFPARAARELGWTQVPLLDALEIPVPGSLSRCIRVMLLWNTEVPQASIQHIYQNDAVRLRPDLASANHSEQESAR